MRTISFFFLLLFSSATYAQLGFCEGSKGDPIFHEDFGAGTSSGPALPATVTNYTYVTGDPQDGEYTISSRIGQDINSWHSGLPSSTVSNGRALIVNADYTSGRFYRTQISGLCQNTTYEFSAYLMNIYNRSNPNCPNGGIPINVRFEIWDETDSFLLKEGSTGSIASTSSPQWKQFALTFQSQAGQNSIILKMFNNAAGGCGNDLAIDDVIFRSCGDLTTVTPENDTASRLDICEENAPLQVTLKATPDNTVYSTHFFQWQESSDQQNWTDIAGETGDTYTTNAITSGTYYRVKVAENALNLQNNLCSSASEAFFANIVETPNPPVSSGNVKICSNDPFPELFAGVEADESVNWYDAPSGGNLLAENTKTYLPKEEGTFYAEAVKTNYNCTPGQRTAISFTIVPSPATQDEVLYLCEDATLTLDANLSNLNYAWSTGETSETITVSTEGNYWVEITNMGGCSVTKNIEVLAVEVPFIKEITSEGRQIRIELEAEGAFEFSIDGVNFQESNILEDVHGGIYTAYVRDLSGCNIISEEFAHLVIPQYITPNNDGYNDFFELKGVSFFEASQIRIFDRFGKILSMGPGQNFQWDGSFNGQPLPAEDYWYDIIIEGFENINGNFSLIR